MNSLNASLRLMVLLLFIFAQIQHTLSMGYLYVKLEAYQEIAMKKTSKCIQLCVTTSPTGYPRCNLNTSTGTAAIHSMIGRAPRFLGYPTPYDYKFKFQQDWKDNSELSVIVWERSGLQACSTTDPKNNSTLSTIIPRLEQMKTYYVGDIRVDGRTQEVRTRLVCHNPGCIPPCVPRDNITGHYDCVDGNKKCLPNWFGESCTKFCNISSLQFKCDRYGKKKCTENWFGANCTKFCNSSSKTYTCDTNGEKRCRVNYHGVNCTIFCDQTARNYLCDINGNKVCLKHWYGEDCSKYCDNSAVHYKCSDTGERVCSRNWYTSDCTKFCNNSDFRFKCDVQGDKICIQNWYGRNCSKFCDNSALLESGVLNYYCDKDGIKRCVENWYGDDCNIFCTGIKERSGLYYCESERGIKQGDVGCPESWNDTKCLNECDENEENVDVRTYIVKCKERESKAWLCANETAVENRCSYTPVVSSAQKGSSHDTSSVKLFGGLFGCLFLILIVTTIIIVHVSLKKRKATTASSAIYENPAQMSQEIFDQKFNRAEMILNIDELLRRRQSSAVGLEREHDGMMVANPLYDSSRQLRATIPFNGLNAVVEDEAI